MKFMFIGYCISGTLVPKYQERGLSVLHHMRKTVQEIIGNLNSEWEILVQDESIFVYDSLVRRKKWTAKGVRPTVITTGSHQKTCVFGTLSLNGRQLFRQYNRFNEDTFLSYLKKVKRKFHKSIIFLDREAVHNTIDLKRSIGIFITQ
jgi:hypothetical protein